MSNKFKWKWLSIVIVSSLIPNYIVSATTISELESQKLEIKNKQKDTQDEKEQKEGELRDNKQEQDVTIAEIERVDKEIKTTSEEIETKNREIQQLENRITEETLKIEDLEKKMKARDDIIRERLVKTQLGGWNASHMEVILGSVSFADFIERSSIISQLVRADRDIFEQQERDIIELEAAKEELSNAQKEVIVSKDTLEELQANLESMKQDKEEIMERLRVEADSIQEQVLSAEEVNQILANQENEINKLLQMEQERIEREAAEAAAAAAAEAAAAARKNSNTSSNSSSNNNSNSGGNNNSNNNGNNSGNNSSQGGSNISRGAYINPAPGIVTSPYGPRWSGFHYGIDIAKSGSDVPIVSVADGIVTSSYYSTSYGNVVMVSHIINGKLITSLYAHMSIRSVSIGKVVKQGDRLGTMGNTGESFGQHLHFELMNGGWQANHLNTFDPLPYLNY